MSAQDATFVGFASTHGSTREIAERLAECLRERGLRVDVVDLAQPPPDLSGYAAFVLGSAVHGRRWLPEARSFLADLRSDLPAVRTWIFSVGMVDAFRRPFRSLGRREDTSITDDLDPAGAYRHRLFSGVVRRDAFPLIGRLALWAFSTGPGDYRNWDDIDAWGYGIADSVLCDAARAES